MFRKVPRELVLLLLFLFFVVLFIGAFAFSGSAIAQVAEHDTNAVADARLRVAHLAPFDADLAATAVDVKLGGTSVLTAVQYLSSTTYISVPEGEYLVEIFPTGVATPTITATVALSASTDYTAIAYGDVYSYPLTLDVEADDNTLPAAGMGKVRFGHLAPFNAVLADTEAEIRTDDGSLVFGPVLYGDIAGTYLELAAGDYDLKITAPGNGETLISLAPFSLNEGDILYAVVVGDGSNQDLGVFAYYTDVEGFLLPTESEARLRVAHLAPFDADLANTAVDVKVDGNEVVTDFQYLESTTYIEVADGEHLVEIFPTGEVTPVITGTVDLALNSDNTAIAHGGVYSYPLSLAVEVDDNSLPAAGMGKVRFGHLAPFAAVLADTEAEIRTDDGSLVFGPVLYGDIAGTYLELAVGDYDLKITAPGNGETLINLAPFTLNEGDILYAVVVGDGTNQDLGVFAYYTDLEGFLLPTESEARLRLAHLAPFDADLADTAVDVKVDGTEVVTGFQYLDSTTYIEVADGEHLVEVFPTGVLTPVITGTVDLAANTDNTAIARGGVYSYPLALAAFVDDNSLPATGMGKIRFGHLAPFTAVLSDTEAEIRTDNGSLVFGPVLYGDIAGSYLELAAGNYDLKITAPGNGEVLINLAPFTLNEGDILYALVVGDGTNQELGVFAYPTDVEGFLMTLEAKYQLYMPIILK